MCVCNYVSFMALWLRVYLFAAQYANTFVFFKKKKKVLHFKKHTNALGYSEINLFGEQPARPWPDGSQQSMRMEKANQKAGTLGTSTEASIFPL